MTTVFMFPGQSSRDPRMLQHAIGLDAENRALVEQASDTLGRDLLAHYAAANEAMFDSNQAIQVGVFLANHLFLHALTRAGVEAELSLGLSLGEYNHLVHIGAIDFPGALRLVEQRGACYDRGPDGVMVSIFPIALEDLQPALEEARRLGVVDVANLNSPTQQVIAGQRAAVEAVLARLEQEQYLETAYIEQHCPVHSSVFQPVAECLGPVLAAAPFRLPRLPYLPNVFGQFTAPKTEGELKSILQQHVHRPVLWRDSIDTIINSHQDACFVEVGPRAVLFNLLRPSWHKLDKFKTDSPSGDPAVFAEVVEQLLQRKVTA